MQALPRVRELLASQTQHHTPAWDRAVDSVEGAARINRLCCIRGSTGTGKECLYAEHITVIALDFLEGVLRQLGICGCHALADYAYLISIKKASVSEARTQLFAVTPATYRGPFSTLLSCSHACSSVSESGEPFFCDSRIAVLRHQLLDSRRKRRALRAGRAELAFSGVGAG